MPPCLRSSTRNLAALTRAITTLALICLLAPAALAANFTTDAAPATPAPPQNEPNTTSDWPQFLGPSRSGLYTGPPLSQTWPPAGPPVLWRKDVGQGFAGPVVASGKLILFHRLNNQETLDCLDPSTGQPLWSSRYPTQYVDDFGFDEGPRATPTISSNRIYTFGADGALNCWDLSNGKPLWSVDTKTRFNAPKGFFGVACSPLLEGQSLILNIGSLNNAGIVAFDKETGKVLWQATNDQASYSSPVAATFNGKRYALVFTRSGLTALDPATGQSFFRFPFRSRERASVNAATPLVIDDTIFLSASYQTGATLLRFHEQGPQPIWSNDESLSSHYATPVHHNGFLYGFDGRQEQGPSLRCVELATGKVRWSEDNFGAGTLMLAHDQLLILTEKGELIRAPASPTAFKPSSKVQILGFQTRAYPALANGLYFARDKQKLICLDLRKKN